MKAETKFNAIVLAGTSLAMYFFVMFATEYRPANLDKELYKLFIAPALTVLLSVGSFKLLAQLLTVLLRKVNAIKKFVLGPEYLEGTWVGTLYGKTKEIYTIVEHYEQNHFETIVRGRSFDKNGNLHAMWHTLAVKIHPDSGTVACFYQTNILHSQQPIEGIGHYDLTRSAYDQAPTSMVGYVFDVGTLTRMPIVKHEKMSDSLLEFSDALAKYR